MPHDTAMSHDLVENTAGRRVPAEINGQPAVAYQGVGKFRPTRRQASPPIRTCSDYPADGNKVVQDIATALKNAGVRDGMTISTHHHFCNGDKVACAVFDAAAALGVKDLRWFPSASFPCHASITNHLDIGIVHHIEGSKAEVEGMCGGPAAPLALEDGIVPVTKWVHGTVIDCVRQVRT